MQKTLTTALEHDSRASHRTHARPQQRAAKLAATIAQYCIGREGLTAFATTHYGDARTVLPNAQTKFNKLFEWKDKKHIVELSHRNRNSERTRTQQRAAVDRAPTYCFPRERLTVSATETANSCV